MLKTSNTPPDPATLPSPLALDFRAINMTDEQFVQFCADNGELRFELTADNELIVLAPEGMSTSSRSALLLAQLVTWASQDRTGLSFGSSGGFTLPNGAVRSPDACWILRERWNALSDPEKDKFSHIVPEFVLELRSPSDRLADAQRKMVEYVENGVLLGWLIDPLTRSVYVYRPGQAAVRLEEPRTLSGEPVLRGFDLDLEGIW